MSGRWRAEVLVRLKEGVFDPQGAVVEKVWRQTGHVGVEAIRLGRLVDLWLEAPDAESARRQAEELAGGLLANPVLETYTVRVSPGEEG
ncbi:MAG: phosphoribosylformylglycinamidine synthase subunit PurS [Firmicutes bacterium]|nr:phosphoribosylformylglycinamidine synthase subunit PurS [Bacillota bacterium]